MVANHVLVQLKPGVENEQLDAIIEDFDIHNIRKLSASNTYVFQFREFDIDTVPDAILSLKEKSSLISLVEADYLVYTQNIPNDPRLNEQWNLVCGHE